MKKNPNAVGEKRKGYDIGKAIMRHLDIQPTYYMFLVGENQYNLIKKDKVLMEVIEKESIPARQLAPGAMAWGLMFEAGL